MDLQTFFTQHPCAALAFSGGVDSSYLMYAAKQYGCALHAYFIKSSFQPEFELNDAKTMATELDGPPYGSRNRRVEKCRGSSQ
nr:hypothetical protein [uncultured Caproiciproducens sp.]